MGHHAGGGSQEEKAHEIAGLVAAAGRHPTRETLMELYDAVCLDGPLAYVGPMMGLLGQLNATVPEVHGVGRWLATTAAHRGAAKAGMLILGGTVLDDEDLAILRTLGAHEEFTLYAAIALRNGLPAPDRELWALAKVVDGWGRIQSVEWLQHTTDPEIRSWILRAGYRNTVMYEYLAHIAATTGDLVGALQTPHPDRELLTAAGEILTALIAGGPAQDIHDYTEAPAAVEAFLGHMLTRAETFGDHEAVSAIRAFLTDPEALDPRDDGGWTVSLRERLGDQCAQLLGQDVWRHRIAEGLRSGDRGVFWAAHRAAQAQGIDTFDLLLGRLVEEPFESWWFQAWQQADGTRARELVDLAYRVLPLGEIATGPHDELGFGAAFSAHRALDWSLQALRDFPGLGSELLAVALRSPVVRNRNMALTALAAWPPAQVSAELVGLVGQLASGDPDESIRVRARELLDGISR